MVFCATSDPVGDLLNPVFACLGFFSDLSVARFRFREDLANKVKISEALGKHYIRFGW